MLEFLEELSGCMTRSARDAAAHPAEADAHGHEGGEDRVMSEPGGVAAHRAGHGATGFIGRKLAGACWRTATAPWR